MFSFEVNGKKYAVDVGPDVPLLWVIREQLGLMGTKYGCGIGVCGSCIVHIDGEAERSCQVPVKNAEDKKIITIEGLPKTHPVKEAWIAEEVSQCGYCIPGQVMTAAALLKRNPKPTDADIDNFMSGVICRCGTYQRIRRAIHRAAGIMAKGGKI